MHIQEISLKKLNSIFFNGVPSKKEPTAAALQMQAESMRLGFIFDEKAFNVINDFSTDTLAIRWIYDFLKKIKGVDKTWKPFYQNFPSQIRELSDFELLYNAVKHYWTYGEWKPEYRMSIKTPVPVFENVNFTTLSVVNDEDLMKLFESMLGSNGALTPSDLEIMETLINKYSLSLRRYIPENIPFKETLCKFIGICFNENLTYLASVTLKTTTDVLRVACHFSNGDVSLSKNTHFKLSRPQRKFLLEILENVISSEDVARHKKQWQKLFHCLHPHSYGNTYLNVCNVASKLFDNNVKSFNSKIETALNEKNEREIIGMLIDRPGDFGRRLDKVLRESTNPQQVLEFFEKIAHKIDNKVLWQMYGHFKNRNIGKNRIAFPKGEVAKAWKITKNRKELSGEINGQICNIILNTIQDKYAKLPLMGNVYISPNLMDCPIPYAMRNSASGLKQLARGTKLDIGEGDVLRFFVHWYGSDIDLSAVFLDCELNYHSAIAYYNLRSSDQIMACHSGDITYAPRPDGGCEFIDVNLTSIRDKKIRYIAMDVRKYFGNFEDCTAGWMMRSSLGSENGEIFDAKTVFQKFELPSTMSNRIPALFDIKERKFIWVDLNGTANNMCGGNNVESNKANISDIAYTIINSVQPTLYDLFTAHAKARGKIVDNPQNADIVFDENIVYDYTTILSKYL